MNEFLFLFDTLPANQLPHHHTSVAAFAQYPALLTCENAKQAR
jgi:hypothetical protein